METNSFFNYFSEIPLIGFAVSAMATRLDKRRSTKPVTFKNVTPENVHEMSDEEFKKFADSIPQRVRDVRVEAVKKYANGSSYVITPVERSYDHDTYEILLAYTKSRNKENQSPSLSDG